MEPEIEAISQQIVSDFLAQLEEDERETTSELLTFAVSKAAEEQLVECLQKKFQKPLNTKDRDAITENSTRLYQYLARLLHTKAKPHTEVKYSTSLHVCCAVLTLLDFKIAARDSLSILIDHFGASIIDCFKLIKCLLFERKCKDLAQYMDDVVASIVQSLLWKPGSTLWTKVACNEFKLPSYEVIKEYQRSLTQNRLKDAQRDMLPQDKSEDIPSKNNTHNLTSPISLLFQDIYGYTFKRLEALCEILSTSEHLQDMWTSFNHVITDHCQKILYDRDLDQVILCIVYAVCKAKIPVLPPEFKTITRCYSTLPHSDPMVPVAVSLADQNSKSQIKNTGNIVKFYNKIFLPPLKKFMRSNITSSKDCSTIKHSPIPTRRDSSVRVSGNVYVSPLRKGLASPQRSMEYKFSSSPSSQLQSINKMLRNSPLAKRNSQSKEEAPQPTKAKRISFQSDDGASKMNTSLLR